MQIKNIKTLILGLFTSMLFSATAQTFSPFSQYGVGLQRSSVFSGNIAMGGISAGFTDSKSINFTNPASYASAQNTLFELGGNMTSHVLSDTARISDVSNAGVRHMAMLFPIMKDKWGLSFGLLPYSNVNYRFAQNNMIGDQSFKNINSGNGSTYQFYIGNGFKFGNFSFGLNAGFLFGQMEYSNAIVFPENSGARDVQDVNQVNLRDFTVNGGIQYSINLSKIDKEDGSKEDIFLTFGAYGAPPLRIKSIMSNYLQSTRPSFITGDPIPIDTAMGAVFNRQDNYTMPAYFGTGFTVGNEKTWILGLDFHYENWKNFASPLASPALLNDWKFKFGSQIIPKFSSNKLRNRIEYRFGAFGGKTRYNIDNQAALDFGTTFGVGLPFRRVSAFSTTYSKLNLSMEIGRRGLMGNEALKENYYQLTVAITISDRWFMKRKFD